MAAVDPDTAPREDPLAHLEQALIDEFIHSRGYLPSTLLELPEEVRVALLKDASRYASGKLSEVESRARLLHELHHEKSGPEE